MKPILILLLVAFGFQLSAQTHQIGLNCGVNQLLSIDEGPPFGGGSPWESKLGFGFDLSYFHGIRLRQEQFYISWVSPGWRCQVLLFFLKEWMLGKKYNKIVHLRACFGGIFSM